MDEPGHESTGWIRWRPAETPADEMTRDALRHELERTRRELASYRTDLDDQVRQLEASRDRYADLYDFAPVGYVTLDRNGLIADVNLIAARTLGVQRKHLVGHPFSGCVDSSAVRSLLDHMRRCRNAEGELITSELWLATRDPRPIYAQLVSRPVLTGSACYFRTAIIDQTERHRAESALRDSEQRFRALVTASSDVVYRMSPDWSEMRYVEGRDLVPDNFKPDRRWMARYIPPEDRAKVRKAINEVIRTKSTFELEHRVRRVDGTPGWTFSRAVPILDAAGEIIEWFGTASDITQRKEAERALQERKTELQTLNRVLQQRTEEAEQRSAQLRAMALELTRAEQRERRRLAQVLHDHLQQILVAAKMQAGLMKGSDAGAVERTSGELRELLDEAIDSSRNLSHELCPPVLYDRGLVEALRWLARRFRDQHGVEVELRTDPRADPPDQDLRAFLFQAVRELLLNALKHGGATQVSIETACEGGVLIMTMEDNGTGCEPDQLFQQPETGGFGLFSIKERLDMLDGSMSIRTAPGEGCGVTLRCAASEVCGDEGGEANRKHRRREAGAEEGRPETRNRAGPDGNGDRAIRVMLVDDHRIVREGLAGILRAEPDIELVAEAADGREAVDAVEGNRPDVIVMDVSMPVMDGVDATRIILRDHPAIRVIGLSMHDREDLANAMSEAGASAYLTKGGPARELIETIRQHATGQQKTS